MGQVLEPGVHCDFVLVSNDFHSNLCNCISDVAFFEVCKKLIVGTVHVTLETEPILQQCMPTLRLFFGLFSIIVQNKTFLDLLTNYGNGF